MQAQPVNLERVETPAAPFPHFSFQFHQFSRIYADARLKGSYLWNSGSKK